MSKYSYRIYYEDTDAGGVVYYANYLKFYERARTDFLRDLGVSQHDLMQREKIAFVVRKCDLHYVKPAKLDDLVDIKIEVKNIGGLTIDFEQRMILNDQILNKLNIQIVCVDSTTMSATTIPTNIIEKINV